MALLSTDRYPISKRVHRRNETQSVVWAYEFREKRNNTICRPRVSHLPSSELFISSIKWKQDGGTVPRVQTPGQSTQNCKPKPKRKTQKTRLIDNNKFIPINNHQTGTNALINIFIKSPIPDTPKVIQTQTNDKKSLKTMLNLPCDSYITSQGKTIDSETPINQLQLLNNQTIDINMRIRGGSKTRIIHQNVNSIMNRQKKLDIIDYLEQEKTQNNPIDFLLLTETWLKNKGAKINETAPSSLEKMLKYNLENEYSLITCEDDIERTREDIPNGKGTAIIFNNDWKPFVKRKHRIPGRASAIYFERNERILIMSVYLPSSPNHPDSKRETKSIINEINRWINDLPASTLIIAGGDWNTTLNPSIDRIFNNEPTQNIEPESKSINSLLNNIHNPLHDIWRINFENKKEFTHTANVSGGISEARLDMFLISEKAITKTISTRIMEKNNSPTETSPHRAIEIILDIASNRINQKNLRQPQPQIIRKTITEESKQAYATHIENNQILNAAIERAETSTNNTDQAISELVETTRVAVKIAAKKTLHMRKKNTQPEMYHEKDLTRIRKITTEIKSIHHSLDIEISDLEIEHNETITKIANKWNYAPTTTKVQDITTQLTDLIKKNLMECRKKRKEQNMNRLEVNFMANQGKVIENILENKIHFDGINYVIEKQENNEEIIITEPIEVKKATAKFYNNLFTKTQEAQPTPLVIQEMEPKIEINEDWYNGIMDEITDDDIKNALKTMGNNKAAGPSQTTKEHYEFASNKIIKAIRIVLNHIMKGNPVPENINSSRIILLAKKPDVHGNLDNTRPITLLEIERKILTTIITKRLTERIDKHNILKGYNFGFRTGKSTADVLDILRLCIDDSKIMGKRLIIANLDIKKAYDSVPWTAMEATMKRIKLPQEFIKLLERLDKNRTTTISTQYGNTDKINITRGLPQGDIISPILWAIFYDGLLCILKEKIQGYKIKDINISAAAFADDLTPFTTTPEEMQDALNIIHEYLSSFSMTMNPNKCEIIANTSDEETNELRLANFNLGGQPIGKIKSGSEITRYLGTFITLDGLHKKTIIRAKENVDKITNLLMRKQCPGQVTVYIVNTCLIPKIAYQLQITPVPNHNLNTMDAKIRKLARKKLHLPVDTPSEIMYAREMGIQLISLKDTMTSKYITNAALRMMDMGIVGNLYKAFELQLTEKMKLPRPLLYAPITINSKKNEGKSLVSHVANKLVENQLRLREIENIKQETIDLLNVSDYNNYYKQIMRFNLNNPANITEHTTTKQRNTRERRPPMTISYDFWVATSANKHKKINKIPLKELPYIPEFYKAALRAIADTNENEIEITNKKFKIKTKQEQINANPTPVVDQEITIWTDGSLKENKLGSAAILTKTNQDNITEIIQTVKEAQKHGKPSSTTAEIHAIYIALNNIHTDQKVTIKTDSMAAIAGITAFEKHKYNTRKQLKLTNYPAQKAINEIINKLTYKPTFIHVPAHTGIAMNELADRSAKEASEYPTRSDIDPKYLKNTRMVYNNDSRIEELPATFLKTKLNTTYRSRINQIIEIRTPKKPYTTDINVDTTMAIIKRGTERQSKTDTRYLRETAFRINTLIRNNPVMTKVSTFTIKGSKEKYNVSETCMRCKNKKETQEHVFECRMTEAKTEQILEKTVEKIRTRYKVTDTYKGMRKEGLPGPPETMAALIGMTRDQFWLSPEARGWITNRLISTMKIYLQDHPTASQQYIKWTKYLMDCYSTALYDTIWLDRNDYTFNTIIDEHPVEENPQKRHRVETITILDTPPRKRIRSNDTKTTNEKGKRKNENLTEQKSKRKKLNKKAQSLQLINTQGM